MVPDIQTTLFMQGGSGEEKLLLFWCDCGGNT
jgi:hypothetical protein